MLDEFRSTNITWDKATSRIYSPVTANESDENGRKLVVQIVNSGQVEDLTGATLHLYWETRDKVHDGLDVFKAVDLKKGVFELSYTTGVLSNKGVLNANLVLIDTVGRVVSERFKITVTEGIDNDAIQSENSFTTLTQALIDVSNLEQNYAPRLNDLTAQLQQKADKSQIGEPTQEQVDTWLAANPQATTTVQDKSVTPLKTTFFQTGKNLFDKTTATLGFSINHDGSLGATVGAFVSDFIRIEEGTSYVVPSTYPRNRVAYYDAQKVFITDSWVSVYDILVSQAPPNAVFARFSGGATFIETYQVEEGTTPTPYEPYETKIGLEYLPKVVSDSVPVEESKTKAPTSQLVFIDSPLDVQAVTKGNDGFFYVVNTDGLIGKYASLTTQNDPLETGMTWDKTTHGDITHLFVIDDGVVFFTNNNNGTNTFTRIYRSDSINGVPTLVYEASDKSFNPAWSRQFGVEHYYNGKSYFLAGTYGSGKGNRDLVVSTDNGRTFRVIKNTVDILGVSGNSHWHDVSIDVYRGLIWASEGDGDNRHVYYSQNWGTSWIELTDTIQPTSIMPYPDKVIFGRDNGQAGFDAVDVPDNISTLNTAPVYTYKVFKGQSAAFYFAMKPVVYENETYVNFHLYNTAHSPMMVASGDFGETWHGIWSGVRGDEPQNFVTIDETYVYAYKNVGTLGGLVYAEKPQWI